MIIVACRIVVEFLVSGGVHFALYVCQIFLISGEGTFVFSREPVQSDILLTACAGCIIKGIYHTTIAGNTPPNCFFGLCCISINGQTVFKELLAIFEDVFRYFAKVYVESTFGGICSCCLFRTCSCYSSLNIAFFVDEWIQ